MAAQNMPTKEEVSVSRDMTKSGDVAKLRPHAVTVYLVIMAHTNFNDGTSFPCIDTISKLSGMSESQVKRSITQLEKFGYLSKGKKGNLTPASARKGV